MDPSRSTFSLMELQEELELKDILEMMEMRRALPDHTGRQIPGRMVCTNRETGEVVEFEIDDCVVSLHKEV